MLAEVLDAHVVGEVELFKTNSWLNKLIEDAENAVGRVEELNIKPAPPRSSPCLLSSLPYHIFVHVIWRAAVVGGACRSDILEWRAMQLPSQAALKRHLSLRHVCRHWEVCVNQCLQEHLEELKALPTAKATNSGLRMLCGLSRMTLNDLANKSIEARISRPDQEPKPPKCAAGHYTYMSQYNGDGYQDGWGCNACGCAGRGERWFCRKCSEDYCFDCCPNTRPVRSIPAP